MHKKKHGYPKGKKHSEIVRSPLGERLFKTRKARGLSQIELGSRVGLSQRMISHYEGDPPDGPPLSTLSKIAEVLNVTVSYLLGESTQKTIKDSVDPKLRNYVLMLQKLPPSDRKVALRNIETLAKDNGIEI
jgi:transcriptional regulator with XRE-family HTH domain